MEDDGTHPQDAFELGRAAAAKLKEHNEELSHELPDALQNLFADTEFQEAMVDSGVVTNQRQTLTPIASYSYHSHHVAGGGASAGANPGSSSTRMLTRRGQQNQINQEYYNSRSPSTSPQKSFALLEPPTTRRSQSHGSVELEEEVDKGLKSSKSRRIEEQSSWKGQEEVVETTTSTSTEIDHEVESSPQHGFVLLGTGTTTMDGDDDDGVENPREGTQLNSNQTQDGQEMNCLSCNSPLGEQKRRTNDDNNLMLRDLLWLSLGMTKFYNRTLSSFPFCDSCTSKMKKLSDICTQIGQLEDEFNEIRVSLCEGIISKHMQSTKAVEDVTPQQKGFLKATALRRMQKDFSSILPGKQLLKDASRYLQHNSKADEKQSAASDDSDEGSGGEAGITPAVFECRFCDEAFKTKRAMTAHEQKNHKRQGTFQCHVCDKHFSTQKTLTIHTTTHATEKPHKCKWCEKTFTSKANLRDHTRRHIGFRPFECTICLEKYFVMRHLHAHFLKRHPEKDPTKHVKRLAQPPEMITGL